MVEDIARNLAPAAELGMTTAWVRNDLDWAASDADSATISTMSSTISPAFSPPPCVAERRRKETR